VLVKDLLDFNPLIDINNAEDDIYNKIETSTLQTEEQSSNNVYSYCNNKKDFEQNEKNKSYLSREIAKSNLNQIHTHNSIHPSPVDTINIPFISHIFFYISQKKRELEKLNSDKKP
jgi:hypothetical protein